MRKVLFVICLSVVAALVAAGPASAAAKGPYANIKVTATCSVKSGGVLDVTVGWVYADPLNPGPAPIFSHETLILQKHVQGTQFADLMPPLTDEVVLEPADFSGSICGYKASFDGSNALRVEAQLTVDNANPNRTGGNVFKARCVSFEPPACTTP
jgi:hypothetical protein